jgi:photosystem II stability/assembly factor-like uncharacterized protein
MAAARKVPFALLAMAVLVAASCGSSRVSGTRDGQSGGSAGWVHVATVPAPLGFAFRDASYGWLISSRVQASTDGGAHWSHCKAPIRLARHPSPGLRLRSLADVRNPAFVGCSTTNTIWLAFQGPGWPYHELPGTTGLLVSHNGGRVWHISLVLPGRNAQVQSVSWLDDRTGWVLCTYDANNGLYETRVREFLLRTADGGQTWHTIWRAANKSERLILSQVIFSSATQGWAWADGTGALQTSDSGASWHPTARVNSNNAFTAMDATHAWVVGGVTLESEPPVGDFESTADGGVSWQTNPQFDSVPLYGVFFTDERHGWVGGDKSVFGTSDGGASFTKELTIPGIDAADGWFFCLAGRKVMALASVSPEGELYARPLPK